MALAPHRARLYRRTKGAGASCAGKNIKRGAASNDWQAGDDRHGPDCPDRDAPGPRLAAPLPSKCRLVRRDSRRSGLQPSGRSGGELSDPSLHKLFRPSHVLCRDGPAGRCGGARVTEPRRRQRDQGRPLPAELPDLHRLLLRGAESWRHGRQLQSAVHGRGARLPGQGQRDRDHGHTRPQDAVREGRRAARQWRTAARRRVLVCQSPAGAEEHTLQALQTQTDCAAEGVAVRQPHRVGQRLPGEGGQARPRADRSRQRHRGSAIHGRDDGHAEGGDAHAREPDAQHASGDDVGARSRARAGTRDGRSAVFSMCSR